MTEYPPPNPKTVLRGCIFLGSAFLLFGTWFVVWWVSVVSTILGPKEPPSLVERLPESVVVLEEFTNRSGLDWFFLLKARFSSEDDIDKICEEFLLLPDQDDVSPLSFAGLYDEEFDIPWFPLSNVSRRYALNSVNRDGTWKENTYGRYEAVLWIDDDNEVLILQLACH